MGQINFLFILFVVSRKRRGKTCHDYWFLFGFSPKCHQLPPLPPQLRSFGFPSFELWCGHCAHSSVSLTSFCWGDGVCLWVVRWECGGSLFACSIPLVVFLICWLFSLFPRTPHQTPSFDWIGVFSRVFQEDVSPNLISPIFRWFDLIWLSEHMLLLSLLFLLLLVLLRWWWRGWLLSLLD